MASINPMLTVIVPDINMTTKPLWDSAIPISTEQVIPIWAIF
jgi:hypothetical protein